MAYAGEHGEDTRAHRPQDAERQQRCRPDGEVLKRTAGEIGVHVHALVEDTACDPSNDGCRTDDERDGRCNVLYYLSFDVLVIDNAWVNWKNRSARERCFHFAS